MLFWVRNLPLFSDSCKWDVTRYIYNLGIFSSIFNIFQFLHYSKRQHSYFLLNCNHQRSKMTSLKTICPLLIKIFSNISEQPWMGVMIMLQVFLFFFSFFSMFLHFDSYFGNHAIIYIYIMISRICATFSKGLQVLYSKTYSTGLIQKCCVEFHLISSL